MKKMFLETGPPLYLRVWMTGPPPSPPPPHLSQGLDPDPLVPRFNEAAWIDLQDVRDCTACFIPLAFYSAARFFRRRILGTSANEKVREICALHVEISSKEQGQSS